MVAKGWSSLVSSPLSGSSNSSSGVSSHYFKRLVLFIICLLVTFFILIHYTYPLPSLGYSTAGEMIHVYNFLK